MRKKLIDVELVKAKHLDEELREELRKQNKIKNKNSIIAIHSFTGSEPKKEYKKYIEIENNDFVTYVLKRIPSISNK